MKYEILFYYFFYFMLNCSLHEKNVALFPYQLVSIIVFGCLADKSYSDETDHCLIHDSDACNLGVGVGVVAMLMCLAAYTKDFMYAFISNHQVSVSRPPSYFAVTRI